jgi:hypothetical protein
LTETVWGYLFVDEALTFNCTSPSSTKESELSSHTLDTLRVGLNRELDLLNERAKMFLTFHSLLITAYAFGRTSLTLTIILPLLGLATTFLWLYLGHRTLLMYGYFRDTVTGFEANLPEADRVFTMEEKFREETKRPILGFRVSSLFGYGLPLILVATWIAILVSRP